MILRTTVADIADRLSAKGYTCSASKEKSIYLYNIGYNTKNVTTKVRLSFAGHRCRVHITVECDTQPDTWCELQAANVTAQYRLNVLARWVNIHFTDHEATAEAMAIADQAAEANGDNTATTGYTTDWREVRVPINRFGKLVTRKRQYMVGWQGRKADAPRRFIELDEQTFRALFDKKGEHMLEPFQEPPELIKIKLMYQREAIA